MATKTDSYGFNEMTMFQVARDCSPDDHKHTQNLVESKDDMLFVWNAKNCCVMTLNWRAAASKKQEPLKHQTLIPSAPQNFTVEKILPSTDGTFLALAGPNGFSIIELPRRWGPNGQYQNGKECIICRNYNPDEHLFTESATLELLQIRWHPASPTDSHLLVLLSDNSIRVYDVDSLRHVWRIGPTPTPQAVTAAAGSSPTGKPGGAITSKLAYLNSLGDTAVDFDIAPPRVVSSAGAGASIGDISNSSTTTAASTTFLSTATLPSVVSCGGSAAAMLPSTPKEGSALMSDSLIASLSKNKKDGTAAGGPKVEWPIVILRGDGSVYVLCAGIDTNRPRLQGPISILPQVDDNYGLDSCSLIVIPTLPPTVIIAESTGKTHHALFLDEERPHERSLAGADPDATVALYPCEWYLHVLETVELELGLPGLVEEAAAKTTTFSCPLHLKRDPLNDARYFAYHNAGLHAVTLDFTRQLHEFVQQPGDDDAGVELAERYPLFSSHSRAEYVVCTKALQNANTNAVLGFTLLQSPSGLVLFLASGQVVSLDLITDHSLIRQWPLTGAGATKTGPHTVESPIKNMLKDSFQKKVQSILKSGLTQPILKLDQSNEPTPQEAFELLSQTTRMLREHYFVRHEKARQEIKKRGHVLTLMKQQQLQEIDELQVEKLKIRETAERLAETYEDLCDKQTALFKRAQEVVRLATLRLPKGSYSEKKFTERIEKMHQLVKVLQVNVDQTKQKIATQQVQLESRKSGTGPKERPSFTLPAKQEEIIKQIIGEMYTQINRNVKDIKKMNSILNLT